MDLDEYKRRYDGKDAAPGWDAINSRLLEAYPGQEPRLCTYGYTSLYYDEEAVGGDYSRYGFEMTFRLATKLPPEEEPIWVCNLLQNIARYVFESGKWFEPYHWIPANGPIRADFETDIVGLAFLADPTLETVYSPHGRIEFIQAFGITQAELDSFANTKQTAESLIELHRKTNPLLVTDLSRQV